GLWGRAPRGPGAARGRRPPARVGMAFGVRCVEALGHRPRLDACIACARAYPFPRPALGDGGVLCEACARRAGETLAISPAAIGPFARLRSVSWDDALAPSPGPAEG